MSIGTLVSRLSIQQLNGSPFSFPLRKISLGTKEAINFTSVNELRFHLLVGLFLHIISEKIIGKLGT